MELTHKEFALLLEASREKTYDQLEKMAIHALMIRRAYHDKKRLKASDLFKRPQNHEPVKKEDIEANINNAVSYLSQFQNFNFENS